MTRNITPFVLGKLKQWEGLRLEAYQDSGGVWTIGYGHTGPDVRKGLRITEARAEELLAADLSRFERGVNNGVKVPLTDNQFGALVSFAFNVGLGDPRNKKAPVGFLTSTLLRKLNAGNYNAVPSELAKWKYDNGKVVQGLVNRRAAEAGLWATGAFVASAPVEAAPARAPLLSGENVAVAGTVASSLAAASASSGPLQYALAACLVIAAGAAAYYLTRRYRDELA